MSDTLEPNPETPFLDRGVDDWKGRFESVPVHVLAAMVPLAWAQSGGDERVAAYWVTALLLILGFTVMYVVARRRGATKGQAVGVILIGRIPYRWMFAARRKRERYTSPQSAASYRKS